MAIKHLIDYLFFIYIYQIILGGVKNYRRTALCEIIYIFFNIRQKM